MTAFKESRRIGCCARWLEVPKGINCATEVEPRATDLPITGRMTPAMLRSPHSAMRLCVAALLLAFCGGDRGPGAARPARTYVIGANYIGEADDHYAMFNRTMDYLSRSLQVGRLGSWIMRPRKILTSCKMFSLATRMLAERLLGPSSSFCRRTGMLLLPPSR